MPKRFSAAVVLVLALACPALGYAQGAKYTFPQGTSSSWTSEDGYTNRAIGKLGFGAKNLLLGWTDLFIEPKEAMDEGGNFFVGLGAGLKDALFNELGGAVHLVTFPITSLDAPLPEGGVQLFNS